MRDVQFFGISAGCRFGGYGESAATTATTITNGNASLSSTNYNRIFILPTGGAHAFNVYRTAGGSTQGLVGTAYAAPVDRNATAVLFSDTGLSGNSASAPSSSTADGSINLPSGANYKINGSQISSSNLSDGPFSSATVYNTVQTAVSAASISATVMATPGVDTNYTFKVFLAQTIATAVAVFSRA
ncbi:MAG: hypothetical protein ACR2JB_04575 [Bryobacteraceae bacterium]